MNTCCICGFSTVLDEGYCLICCTNVVCRCGETCWSNDPCPVHGFKGPTQTGQVAARPESATPPIPFDGDVVD